MDSAVLNRFRAFRDRLWSREAFQRSHTRTQRFELLAGRSLYVLFDALRRSDVQQRASALTMVTLLSLVPALAVVFAILTAFTSLETTAAAIKEFILSSLAADESNEVGRHLERFIANTNTKALGGVGVAFLFLSALSLLANIEAAFNQIWGVKRNRGFFARFQVYWPLITLGPLLLGVSISATTAVIERAPFLNTLTLLTPFVAATLFFGLLYRILPNAKVKTVPALIGGAAAGVLWVTAQRLFALYAKNAISYSQIYGSLAAIPLFILSVHVSWLVILFGANLVFAIQTAKSSELPGSDARELALRDRERLAMLVMARIAERFDGGKGPTRVSQLDDAGWPPSAIRKTIAELVQAGLIVEVEAADPEDPGYLPGKPPPSMTERDVVGVMRGQAAVPDEKLVLGEGDRTVLEAHRRAEQQYLSALEQVAIVARGTPLEHSSGHAGKEDQAKSTQTQTRR
jgi:membrane protein